MPSSLIGAQMAANCQKSHSPQHVCQEHDVADGKSDAAQEQEDIRHCSYWFIRPSLSVCSRSCSLAASRTVIISRKSAPEQPQPVHTPQRLTARKANFLSAHDEMDHIHTSFGEFVSFEAQDTRG